MKLSRLIPVSFALFAFAVSAKANIVGNPDFNPSTYQFPGYTAPAGTTTVNPWVPSTVGAGGTPYDTGGFYDYGYNAAHPTAGFIQGTGSISQSLDLIVGQLYTYSFLYDARLGYAPTALTATIGGNTLFSDPLLTPNPAVGFMTASGYFRATSATEDLTFSSSVPSGGDGTSVFTAVNVTATPEPSSLALLGTGVLTAAGVARRKFRKA